MGYTIEPLDFYAVDEWAVNIVVREGARVNLNCTEKLVAVVIMQSMGIKINDMADRLRVPLNDVKAMVRRWERGGRKEAARAGFTFNQSPLCRQTGSAVR